MQMMLCFSYIGDVLAYGYCVANLDLAGPLGIVHIHDQRETLVLLDYDDIVPEIIRVNDSRRLWARWKTAVCAVFHGVHTLHARRSYAAGLIWPIIECRRRWL